MRTWSATFLASFVMGLFAYVTFIKENPASPWWWVLAFIFVTQIILNDAADDYNTKSEESIDPDSKDDE